MFPSDTLAASNGGNGTGPKVPTATPSPEGESRSGLPSGIAELKEKRRGTKPGSTRGPYNKGPRPTETREPVAPAAPLFTPDNVRPLVSLPFNLALVKTGFEGWALSEGEAATLSNTGAIALNQWVTIDPRYVALILFSTSLISVVAEKTLMYSRALAQEAARLEAARSETK